MVERRTETIPECPDCNDSKFLHFEINTDRWEPCLLPGDDYATDNKSHVRCICPCQDGGKNLTFKKTWLEIVFNGG